MRFYTNVQMVGDNFLVRGYENGKHFATREKFYPTLFVPSKKKTRFKTLEGDYVESVEPGTVVQEIQPGYMFGDRLLRPSLVGISKKNEADNKEKDIKK